MSGDWLEAPTLTGDLVELVPLGREHAAGILAAADDDAVFAWMSFTRPRTLADAEALVDWYAARPAAVSWAQLSRQDGTLAGLTTYYEVDPVNRSLAIGATWLARRHWRTGVNAESKRLLLARAFDDLGCVRVVWHTDDRNERSQAAIARLGATHEGVMRRHKRRPDGSWRDTYLYSLLDDEWPAARAALDARLSR